MLSAERPVLALSAALSWLGWDTWARSAGLSLLAACAPRGPRPGGESDLDRRLQISASIPSGSAPLSAAAHIASAWAQKGAKTAKPAAAHPKLAEANYAFDVNAMGDMSDFDPATVTFPKGDTIKIAVVASFTGPAAIVGKIYWAAVAWAATALLCHLIGLTYAAKQEHLESIHQHNAFAERFGTLGEIRREVMAIEPVLHHTTLEEWLKG
mgnify:CR=1 FL=1